jgi:hypothetical protein
MSINLMDLVKSQLSGGVMDVLTSQLGSGVSKQQTSGAADNIMEVLLGGIARNAQSPDGANALNNALEKDHDGGILDNLQDLLGGNNVQPQYERAMNGAGILKHILGDKQSSVIDAISKSNGLNSNQTGSLMMKLAPLLLGVLGQQKKQNGLDTSGISDLLNGARQQQQQRASGSPLGGMLKNLIDQDGDGNIIDDIGGMLGKFLKK